MEGGPPGEKPRHPVWVDDFAIANTPVTNAKADPITPPPTGATRAGPCWVSRGGAVAHRSSLPPHLRYSDYSFRVVRLP